MHPVADERVRHVYIKKRSKRKGKRPQRYKLNSKYKNNSELLTNLRMLSNEESNHSQQLARARSKRAMLRVLRKYRNWLLNWNKQIKVQQQIIQELYKEEQNCDGRLRHLRNKLRILPKRRKILKRCFRNVNLMLEKSNMFKGSSEQEQLKMNALKAEARQIWMYLKQRKNKKLGLRKIDEDISQFSNFWKSEVVRKGKNHNVDQSKHAYESIFEHNEMDRRKKSEKLLKNKHHATKKRLSATELAEAETENLLKPYGSENSKSKSNPKPNPEMHDEHKSTAKKYFGFQFRSRITHPSQGHVKEKNRDDTPTPPIEIPQNEPVGAALMNILGNERHEEYYPVQFLLRYVIRESSILDKLEDKSTIVDTMRKHYMWKILNGVYRDLQTFGISKDDILKELGDLYVKYTEDIFNEAIRNGALTRHRGDLGESSVITPHDQMSDESLENFLEPTRRSRAISLREQSSLSTEASPKSLKNSVTSLPLRDVMNFKDRYSSKHLLQMRLAIEKYFQSQQKSQLLLQLEERKKRANDESKATQAKPKKPNRKVNIARLFYAPRRTCRQRQVDEAIKPRDSQQETQERCMRCGTVLPALQPCVACSLSNCLISDCVKNKQMSNINSDVFHDQQATLCSKLVAAAASIQQAACAQSE
ncbi:uncharacterized protein LOC6559260 [Drosophila grimshawi]|uniref:GH20271 n=1 Tax=Drosophila grimshawi TaxID=7222 RepID=B4J5D1_DROGR|nr:uncharacterized protein LOC6559260 [Drosophila grimshawi]EDW01773.1 GH20271 [Drosophila grimshawi]